MAGPPIPAADPQCEHDQPAAPVRERRSSREHGAQDRGCLDSGNDIGLGVETRSPMLRLEVLDVADKHSRRANPMCERRRPVGYSTSSYLSQSGRRLGAWTDKNDAWLTLASL